MNSDIDFKDYKHPLGLRDWQFDALHKIDRCIKSSIATEIMPVTACVGSGKTMLSAISIALGILNHEKTVNTIITPRISLCDQQSNEIGKSVKGILNAIDPEHLRWNENDIEFKTIHCQSNDSIAFRNHSFNGSGHHVVLTYCDKSAFGCYTNESNEIEKNYLKIFDKDMKNAKKAGYFINCAFLDEAHNYEKSWKDISKVLQKHFKIIMLSSGTPYEYIRDFCKENPENVCKCDFNEGIDKGYICKPTLNFIQSEYSRNFPSAIASVIIREKNICDVEHSASRILVNCPSIDSITELFNIPWYKDNIGKMFHVIRIHSNKDYDDNNAVKTVTSEIDGHKCNANEALNALETIDEYFNDNLPVVVFQVGMISEGINVKCFNATIITTNDEKTATQQIGRVVRLYTDKKTGKKKEIDGHANVYVLSDNLNSIVELFVKLSDFGLTEKCFKWGVSCIIKGSGNPLDYDSVNPLVTEKWEKISEVEIMEFAKNLFFKKINHDASDNILNMLPKEILEDKDFMVIFCTGKNSSGNAKNNNVKNCVEKDNTAKNADKKTTSNAKNKKNKNEPQKNFIQRLMQINDYVKNMITEQSDYTKSTFKEINKGEALAVLVEKIFKILFGVSSKISKNDRITNFLRDYLTESGLFSIFEREIIAKQ